MIEILNMPAGEVDAEVVAMCDSLITDPPYSPRVHDKATSNGTDGAGPRARDLGFKALTPELRRTIAAAAAGVRTWSAIFSDIEAASEWRADATAARAEYIRAVPWVRWSQPQLSGDRPPSGAELVSVFHATRRGKPVRKSWQGPGSLTHFDSKALRGGDKFSCEKPLDLMLSLVSWLSPAGGTVLDLCGGSGTTAQACRILGRDCILVEIDPDACARAEAKISGPLSSGEAERVRRWVEYQSAWLGGDWPLTQAGIARYESALADTEMADRWLD